MINYVLKNQPPKFISTAASYITVGITDCINFKNINSAWWGLITTPFSFAFSTNDFIVVEWLQGCIVTYFIIFKIM